MTVMMFYKKPVAIDRTTHRNLRFKTTGRNHAFAMQTNSIPVVMAEFGIACREYPIVFVLDEVGGGVPVAVTGLRDNENLFVNADLQWDAEYIPAFVRRYPFLLQGDEKAQEFGVLIDEESDALNHDVGDRLFSEAGNNSPQLTAMLDFLNQYRADSTNTQTFVQHLRKLDLFIPRVINATLANGETLSMNGFHVVDEQKLNALPDADLLHMAKNGYLASIYGHMISLANIQRVLGRLERLPTLAKSA